MGRRQFLSFAENLALLSFLRPAPTAPQTNALPHWATRKDTDRLLSFEREVSLTSTLAFLCGVSDNPHHVVATCVEELAGKKGLRIVVAINKKHATCGSETLTYIKDGLVDVLRHLSPTNDGVYPPLLLPKSRPERPST